MSNCITPDIFLSSSTKVGLKKKVCLKHNFSMLIFNISVFCFGCFVLFYVAM